MSPRKGMDIKIMYNVPLKMRDGVILYSNVYRPDNDEKYPAIVNRTPYLKDSTVPICGYLRAHEIAAQGYNVVIQDVRGAGYSQGEMCDPSGHQVEDGYDTVEGIAAMLWCDGQVGMVGESYHGFSQLAAAQGRPPHLKAICPFQTSWTKFPAIYSYGVFSPILYGWIYGRAMDRHAYFNTLSQKTMDKMEYYGAQFMEQAMYLPMKDMPAASLPEIPELKFHRELLENIDNKEYFKEIGRAEGFEDVEVPCLILTGWYDFLRDTTIYNYMQFKTRGGSEKCRQGGKLIVGPWLHGHELKGSFDGFHFGPQGSGEAVDIAGKIIDWFDYWMKGKESAFMSGAPIKLFIMGVNEWRDEYEWPLARTNYKKHYLHSKGHANSLNGNGSLDESIPDSEPCDNYLYDPCNPVNTQMPHPHTFMIQDQRPNEMRDDVLVYTTEAFVKEVEITGPITVHLYAASTAVDTDFVCKVSDVYPDGRAINLAMRLVRARYRNGDEAELIEPGKVYEYKIDVGNIAIVLKPGHRIRLDITSSLFPDADRNLNTGGRIGYESKYKLAIQSIFHNKEYSSYLELPFIN